ncbi:uncharacterized protein KY384_007831 [Bacidia gigantensis]|uniref:uncharacterized protein n=1 Tax=Bacidia gigantensis TaxID=2732470 RepID=UPI001D03FDCC|nr:uncharacterized protein KY384_007831 [Bacidia gigantensis]KAG8527678.1 hypothetical protein KY384_007831 [Bacidia gigantensis]
MPMPLADLIEISSSEDEAVTDVLAQGNKGLVTNSKYPNSPKESLFLQDDFDTTIEVDDKWEAAPAKRRRLSPLTDHTAVSYASKVTAPHVNALAKVKSSVDIVNRTKFTGDIAEDDPIVFTSSIHGSGAGLLLSQKSATRSSGSDASDDELPNDIFDAAKRLPQLSKRTASLLGSLSRDSAQMGSRINKKSGVHRSKDSGMKRGVESKRTGSNNVDSEGAPKSKPLKLTEAERQAREKEKATLKEARARERESVKAQRSEDKEKEKEHKRLEKLEKAKEKQRETDVAEANRVKVDKKDTTPQMIVDLPASLDGSSLNTQVRELLKNVGADVALYQGATPNVIKWRRKVTRKWNDELGYFQPLAQTVIQDEKHILCHMTGKEFVSLAATEAGDDDLETHVAKMKSAHPGSMPIYLIEGLSSTISKSKNAQQRAWQAQVHRQAGIVIEDSSSKGRKRKQAETEVLDESRIEDALMRLQVLHECLIHHTPIAKESAEWIMNFTQHISLIPYKQQKMNLATGFCMENDQVKCGTDKEDTFHKMLQEVVRVTPPIARGIAYKYASVIALMQGFRDGGQYVLEGLPKRAIDKNEVDGNIGPALSKRLYKVFMGTDETSDDV